VTLGSVLLKDAQPNGIYTGNPATLVGHRTIRDLPGPAGVPGREQHLGPPA
jgi:acetyltransferase-like isoleucine patch superfamily enzyme